MQTFIKTFLETILFVVIKPKMFIFFSLNAHVMMLKDILFFKVYQIWVCISLYFEICYYVVIVIFLILKTLPCSISYKHISYKLIDFIDDICVHYIYYLQLSYAYHIYFSNCCILLFFIIFNFFLLFLFPFFHSFLLFFNFFHSFFST